VGYHERYGDNAKRLLDSKLTMYDHLRSLTTLVEGLQQPTKQQHSQTDSTEISELHVLNILAVRRDREITFPAHLFADPAWDILLELYAAELGQRRMSVTSLCIGAAVPATTALRWIRMLEKEQLVSRIPDALDGRRIYIAMTQNAVSRMQAFLALSNPRNVI
jgi:DNA-binding MarR family transcriptional regulator